MTLAVNSEGVARVRVKQGFFAVLRISKIDAFFTHICALLNIKKAVVRHQTWQKGEPIHGTSFTLCIGYIVSVHTALYNEMVIADWLPQTITSSPSELPS